jgi:diaminopimelate decarboxylase
MAAATQLSSAYPLGSRLDADGVLEVGGCNLLDVAREFGTPAYVIATDDIRTRAQAFLNAFRARTDNFDVLFATKAFPCTAVLRLLHEEGLGCDVASGGELTLALAAGFDPARIVLHGNAKSERELAMAVEAGVGHVVIDNLDELDRLERVAAGRTQRVLLRVTPGVRARTHDAISTGQADAKFGLSFEDTGAAIERARGSDVLDLRGLHMHIGSQIFELAPFRMAVEAIAELGSFEVINLGGGLAAPYLDSDEVPRIEDYVATKVEAVRACFGADCAVYDEPGRALVANAGVTLYGVESVKRNVHTWVGVDGGMSDNLRPMLYDAVYEAEVLGRFHGRTPCRVAGKHCESGDVLVDDVLLDEPRVGDVIVMPATGAYGYSMANNYNGVPRPPVVFVADGDARAVVRRETYEDLLARDL